MPAKEGTLAFKKHVEERLETNDWPGNCHSVEAAAEPFGIAKTTGRKVLQQIATEQNIPYLDLLPHPEHTHVGNGRCGVFYDSLRTFDREKFEADVGEILGRIDDIGEEIDVVIESCTMVSNYIDEKEKAWQQQ